MRILIRFSKLAPAEKISHLELIRIWTNALRNAGVEFILTRGKRPRPKLYFAAVLPVGILSDAEYLEAHVMPFAEDSFAFRDLRRKSKTSPCFSGDDDPFESLRRKLFAYLPAGIKVLYIRDIGSRKESIVKIAAAAEYKILVENKGKVSERFDRYISQDSLMVTKKEKKIDLHKNIIKLSFDFAEASDLFLFGKVKEAYQIEKKKASEKYLLIKATLRLGENSISPFFLIDNFLESESLVGIERTVLRTNIFFAKGGKLLRFDKL
jgi:uncharacterized protein (DUF2344 family)